MFDVSLLMQLALATAIGGVAIMLSRALLLARASGGHSSAKGTIAFLFDGDHLMDATRPARRLMKSCNIKTTELDALLALLEQKFPGIRRAWAGVEENGKTVVTAQSSGDGQVVMEYHNGTKRLSIDGNDTQSAAMISEDLIRHTIEDEINTLRSLADTASVLMWRTDLNGVITWANRSFLDLIDRCCDENDTCWPPSDVFENLPRLKDPSPTAPLRRAVLPRGSDQPLWFDISVSRENDRTLFVGAEVTGLVDSESSKREVLQTLTKTFAGLTVGLAVFDQSRRLVTFNPALGDLCDLKPSDLAIQPRLDSFLDMLRENRILPEPPNYAAWRRQLVEMETACINGNFQESWNLGDGRTFRVTGRPFPNGSVALLIEDVTENIDTDRQLYDLKTMFEGFLEGQTDAIAVFNSAGKLCASNKLYDKLWPGTDGGDNFAAHHEAWVERTRTQARWFELAEFTTASSSSASVAFPAFLLDGTELQVTAHRPSPGALTVIFRKSAAHAPPLGTTDTNEIHPHSQDKRISA